MGRRHIRLPVLLIHRAHARSARLACPLLSPPWRPPKCSARRPVPRRELVIPAASCDRGQAETRRGDRQLEHRVVSSRLSQRCRGCIRSSFELGTVVVVDNASSDDSLEGLCELPLPLRVVRNYENRGFAAASNQGAREGAGDFILFLNPDTRVSLRRARPQPRVHGRSGERCRWHLRRAERGRGRGRGVLLCALPDAMDARRQDDRPRAGVSAVDPQAAARRTMSFPIAGRRPGDRRVLPYPPAAL